MAYDGGVKARISGDGERVILDRSDGATWTLTVDAAWDMADDIQILVRRRDAEEQATTTQAPGNDEP